MKYIIYGMNRVAKDFLYIFDDLEILYITDDAVHSDKFCGYDTKSLDETLSDKSYDMIIICDFDKSDKESRLNDAGLIYDKDYIFEEDFFADLDDWKIPHDRKIAVWGTGNMARQFMSSEFMSSRRDAMPIEIFIETEKTKDVFMDRPVISAKDIDDWKQYFIVIAVGKDADIRQMLFDKGLTEDVDFTSFHKITGMPSVMLRQTIFDRSYYDLECNTMLNHLEILHRGNTRCCCTTFVKQNLDNIFEKDTKDVWHSKLHKVMCLSTENKTYSFCDKEMCPLFVTKKKEEIRDVDRPYKQMSEYPEVLALGHDSSCNLSCETCRRELHFAKGQELEMVNRITDKIKEEYLPHGKFLILAGDGEVFACPSYQAIYESENCRPEYIRLLSNGMLFTPEKWERFRANNKGKIMLTVSVDAATKQTYESIRRSGNFDKLKKNMEFAAELRKSGELRYFRMNFVVQRRNYQEMPLFVEWGEQLGVDEVFFTKILNWGTYTESEFAQVSMMEADGVTPKPELQKVMEHPLMQSKIVDLGTIQCFHKADEVGIVDNYYKWELEKRGGSIFV